MTATFYPKRVLITVVFLIVFGWALSLATDARRSAAIGVLALIAYALIELLITVNPAVWWRERKRRA